MAHTHNHIHTHPAVKGSKLMWTFFINITITLIQVIGSVISGSMALMSDALHNLSDALTIIISWVAERLTKRRSTTGQTFGYRRAEIIAAFINASLLLIIGVFLIFESTEKIINLQYLNVKPGIVILLAGFGIVANGLSVLILKKDSGKNMNLRSAYIHLFTDMLSSFVVMTGGIMIYYFNFYLLDPVLSIGIAIYLIILSWKLVLQSLKVLMQFTPEGLDLEGIAKHLSTFENIKGIHHVHAWQLNDHDIYFEAHVEFSRDISISESCRILNIMRDDLDSRYHIHHTTFQSEFAHPCDKALINQGIPG